mmetsp:Transcript_12246/g.17648  ORF Transcript_12246/g.17648 Transcript_12246/m.17648 type:complete len:153 (-) Transcript_12246:352-810(-)
MNKASLVGHLFRIPQRPAANEAKRVKGHQMSSNVAALPKSTPIQVAQQLNSNDYESSSSVECKNLHQMYDLATWRMYDRITTYRKSRRSPFLTDEDYLPNNNYRCIDSRKLGARESPSVFLQDKLHSRELSTQVEVMQDTGDECIFDLEMET